MSGVAETGQNPLHSTYATDVRKSRGRAHGEPASPTRSAFQRDCDRITHSTAFRRLRDKTQVFLTGEGDHFRTRLTHTLEVARIARTLARSLRLDEDLAEAVALAHDLGHPPFGHAGERALNAAMAPYGGFDHNAQSFRAVTILERRYPRFDGLNLSWEVLEGIAKHNGPLAGKDGKPAPGVSSGALLLYGEGQDIEPTTQPSLEAQLAALADDIAYAAHDIDDGLRAGLLTIEGLSEIELIRVIATAVAAEFPDIERPRFVHEMVRRLLNRLIEDVIGETTRRLVEAAPGTVDDVRNADRALAAFSPAIVATDRALKTYLSKEVYRHPSILKVMRTGELTVARLFARYFADPTKLPGEWRIRLEGGDHKMRARVVADFLAGQTDGFAIQEYGRLFDEAPDFG